jgi:hypothetical protein
MKRLITALLAATLGLGAGAPLVLAQGHEDLYAQRGRWGNDDRWDDRDDRGRDRDWDRDRDRRRSSRYRNERLYSDPVYNALRYSRSIRINNVFAGGRYVASGQRVGTDVVRVLELNGDGSYDVWFNGRVYPAYARSYRGRYLLYVGQAPTREGYQYELIIE